MLCQGETLVFLFRYGKALCSVKLRHLFVYSGMVRPYVLPSWDTCMFIQVWQGPMLCQGETLVFLFRYGKALCSAKLRHFYVYSGMAMLCQAQTLVCLFRYGKALRSAKLRHFYVNSGMAMPAGQCLMLCQAETLVCLLPEASFGLRVLSLPASVCVCVRPCVNHELVRAITHHPFKLGSPN